MNEIMVLDIGTGTVVGFIARQTEDNLEILARRERRYPDRVVREGRIVDVVRAAEFVGVLADELSDEAGVQVNTAHYAVAGRGLDATRCEERLTLDSPREFRPEDWNQLLRNREDPGENRVLIDAEMVRCEIDGADVSNPVGQYGRELTVEWIMNTIPTREIENKRNVLLEADLVPGQVLLEPRAVLRACVPPSDFESPLSVIDFGAGTIDAAYLEKGHVEDFVTFLGSGDALTRRIQAECRTDFSEAEQMKINSGRDEIRYTDLSGETRWISRDDLERIILPVLKEQVFQLKEWFENRTPDLVFLAGGGSQFQFVDRLVSRLLGVGENDVISGLPRIPSHCVDERNLVRSPSDFTALGMLLLVEEGRSRRYLRLNVNGTPYARLIDDETFTVEELCERLGYAPREPDPDSAIMISLDGEWETFRSSARLEPRVRVDGENVTDEYELRSGDDVEISPPEEPQPMELRAGDCLPEETLEVVFEGRKMEIPPCLLGDDGNKLSHDRLLRDGEEYRRITTFTVDRVIEHVRSMLGTAPDVSLWKIDGKYFDRSEFEVGETVDLEGGISVDSVGLGNLSDLPEENIPISSKLN